MAPVAPAETHPDTFGELKANPGFLCRKSGRSLGAELGFAALGKGEGNPCPGLPPRHTETIPAAKLSACPSSTCSVAYLGPLANSGEAAGQSPAPASGISGLNELKREEKPEPQPVAPPTPAPGARRQPPARPRLPTLITRVSSRPTVSLTWKEI